jgi:hypothetical protein
MSEQSQAVSYPLVELEAAYETIRELKWKVRDLERLLAKKETELDRLTNFVRDFFGAFQDGDF